MSERDVDPRFRDLFRAPDPSVGLGTGLQYNFFFRVFAQFSIPQFRADVPEIKQRSESIFVTFQVLN